MGFEPALSRADLGERADVDSPFLDRWTQAAFEGQLPDEIAVEQQKLLDADLIVFQFPLWWYFSEVTHGTLFYAGIEPLALREELVPGRTGLGIHRIDA